MFNPYQIVILDYRANGGHIWRHDFDSRGEIFLNGTRAERFASPFIKLNNYVGKGIKTKIGVHIYNSVKDLPEEYKNIEPQDHYRQY
jgi:hypothetical protein